MNELDLLRALRDSDASPPRPEVRADARRALLVAAGRPGAPRLRPRRPWAMATVSLAAAAGIALALLTGADSGNVAPSAARAALERAASAAEAGAGLDVGPGEFLYIRERDAYVGSEAAATGASWAVVLPQIRETWVARDGSGRVAVRAGDPQFPGPRDRERWERAGSPTMSPRTLSAESGHRHGPTKWPVGARSLSYEELAALPTDGREMYERLLEMAGDTGPSPDGEVFVIVGDLLRSAPVPPPVRAALYRATAFIKDIRFAGEVTDTQGRRGLAVDLPNDHGTRNRLVFDPNTSALLAEEEILTARKPWIDADPGFVIGSRVVLETAVVDSDTARPGP